MDKQDEKFINVVMRINKILLKYIQKADLYIDANLTNIDLLHIGILFDEMEKEILKVNKKFELLDYKN